MRPTPSLALLLLPLAACSSSLTSMQPARTVPEGHVQAATSLSITPPTGIAGDAVDGLRALDDVGRNPTAAEVQQIGEAAAAALVQPPSVDAQLALAYGVNERLELDARVGSTSAGGGFRLQFLRRSPGIYGALGFRVDIGFNAFPVDRFTDRVRIQSFRRQDFSVPLVLGYSRRRVHVWAGPKLMFSRYRGAIAVCTRRVDDDCRGEATLNASGRATYVAGQLGFAIGSNRAWFAVELSIARVRALADLEMQASGSVMEHDLDQRGRVFTPAVGFLLWI